jgi:phosphatidate cytidylyltransferase
MEKSETSSKIYNFFVRSLSVIILAPIVLAIVYFGDKYSSFGDPIYKTLILIMAILMAFEWSSITANQPDASQQRLWAFIGLIYILMPTISLIWIREHAKGREVIFWLLANVWVTDIAAYFAGNLIGGPKLCPNISPNKTWSGLIGGVAGACLVGYITADISHSNKPAYLIILSATLGIYGQIGDLIESWIKRKFNVKDSGKIIPGHGGILDRVDSLVPVAPKVVFVLLFDKWGIF